ncbi:MAG: hypothetical protein ACM3P1_11810 [Candidatus Saccharibacteria bacterium]
MKKFLLPLIAIALFVMQGYSQNAFVKGDKVVNLSIGLGSGLYKGSGYSNVTPAIAGSYEIGVVDNLFDENSSLGVGGYLGYTGAKYNFGAGYGWKYSDIIIGARGAVHYQFVDRLDTYAGLMLGYDIVSSKTYGTGVFSGNASTSGFVLPVFVGGRYYFSDKFAGLVELGTSISYLNIGVAIKL